MNNLHNLSQQNLEAIQINNNEISIYSGILNTDCIVNNVAKIKKSFPSLPIDFFDVFTDRIKANGFGDDRLNDAVNNVIDNCVYPTPTIAQFLSWDKRIKVLTYEDMVSKANELGGDKTAGKILTSQYKPVQFPDREKKVWVHVDDIKMYNLKSIS